MFPTSFLAIVVVVAGVVVLFKTVRMVPQGYQWTVERFGRYTHTMSRGCIFWCRWSTAWAARST